MRYGSVCSGIEAATAAWHPLGWRAAFFSEIESFPRSVLAHHYPEVPNLGDMTKFKEWPDADLDVLVGGTPCQSFSVAGLRKGMADPRGNLALAFLAIADRYRPRWVVWENVPGVLSSISHEAPDPSPPPPPLDLGRDGAEVDIDDEYGAEELHALNSFLAGLSELGYGWALRVLDAQFFGVPQRRRRVFVVGHLGDWRRAAAVLFEQASLRGDLAPRRASGQAVAGTIGGSSQSGGFRTTDLDNNGAFIVDGQNAAAGGEVCGTITQAQEKQGVGFMVALMDERTVTSKTNRAACRADGATPTMHEKPFAIAFQERGRDGGRNCESQEDLAYSLTAPSGGGRHQELNVAVPTAFSCKDYAQDATEDLSPTLRSMHEEDGHANGGGQVAVAIPINADALRGEGTAITPSADAAGRVRLRDPGLGVGRDGDPAGTINAAGPGAVAFESRFARNGRGAPSEVVPPLKAQSGKSGKGDAAPLVAFAEVADPVAANQARTYTREGTNNFRMSNVAHTAMQVRRLTPRECERLQGFPDDYTLIPIGKKMAADGPRYKALGNSMAVPVMQWIGRRIDLVEELVPLDAEAAA